MFGNLKSLQLQKKNSFRALCAISLILLLFGVLRLFGKNTEVCCYQGNPVEEGYTFRLTPGTYTVSLFYNANTDASSRCGITDLAQQFGSVKTNVVHFFSSVHQGDLEVWVYRTSDSFALDPYLEQGDTLDIYAMCIHRNNGMERMQLTVLIALLCLVWLGYLVYQYDAKYPIAQINKNVAFGLVGIFLMAIYPLMCDGLLNSGDLVYHLMRIEGIKDGLLKGQFPVRIAPEWQQGYGYASSIFYGETLLYIGALFRIIGFPVMDAYRILQGILAFATIISAYYWFYRITARKYAGLVCSLVYSLSVYRIYKTFCTGGLGETCALIFLPFIAYGFYAAFTKSVEDREYRKCFLPLIIGFAGLLQSHLLTGEMIGFFTILLCICLWKRVFRIRTFLGLAKTVVCALLLSAWFVVPFADYMLRGDFQIHHVSDRLIQHRGLLVGQLFTMFSTRGSNIFYNETGMYHADPEAVGIALLLGLFVWLFLCFCRKFETLNREEVTAGTIASVFGIIAMVMSLSAFPWDRIQSLGGIFKTLVSSLQFPSRWLIVVTLCLTFVVGMLCKEFLSRKEALARGLYIAVTVACVVVCNGYMINSVVYEGQTSRIYNNEGMGTGYISGAEYLPYGTNPALLMPGRVSAEETITYKNYKKNGLTITFYCENSSEKEAGIKLPLLYYRGYRAMDDNTKAMIPLMDGENHCVTLAVPAGYSGDIRVTFVSPMYWRVAEVISVLTVFVLASVYLYRIPEGKGNKNSTKKKTVAKK